MPIYEYRCRKCGEVFEKIQKFSDPPPGKCGSCGGSLERLLSSPAIQFKGSGWYVTDYARKPARTDTPKSDAADTADTEKKGEAAAKKETESSATKKSESAKSIPDK